MRPLCALCALCVSLPCGCDTPPGPVRHTPTAKLDGRLARLARRVDALGLAPTSVHSTRPATTGDLVRSFDRGEKPGPEVISEPTADERWLASRLEPYEPAIEEQWTEGERGWFTFEPLDDARVRFVAVDETVKFYNEQGRDFENGANLYLSNRSVARLWDRVVLTADPELSVVENEDVPDDDTAVNLRFQELSASARLGPAEVTVGRQPLWWGPGRHGSLILSNNARPFDLVKVSTAGPILLPGYLAHLGLIRGEIFATRLEGARGVPHPYLAGARVESRVLPWLELGASRTAQFGGKHRSVTWDTIWEVITASTENDEDDPGNQIASIDARVIVPWRVQPFEVYGELGGEDEADHFFSQEAYLVGFSLPRLGPSHAFELTFEYTDTTVFGHHRTWYTNSNYPDGYTYHERIIGHHVGTDGQDFFVELRFHPPVLERRLTLAVSYDYEEHFRLDDVTERLHQIRASVDVGAWKRLILSAFVQHDIWENFRQRRGLDERGLAVGVGGRWEF